MTDKDTGLILVCAVRYALGRQSYMPMVVQGYIRRHRDWLDERDIGVMIRDIREADRIHEYTHTDGTTYTVDGLGDTKIDRPGWIEFLKWLEEGR